MTDFYRRIEQWTEDDLQNIPSQENEQYEYKGSSTPKDKLSEKIGKAASAFWNAGGGIFIVGIAADGKIDGGIPETTFGRQSPRDWVDQAIAKVQPPGPYTIGIIKKQPNATSAINENSVIIVIGFGISPIAPHMALVQRHYGSDGYRWSSFVRAWVQVNCHRIMALARLRAATQAAISVCTTANVSRRRSRHCLCRMENSISAIFSQLPCLGV